MTDQERLARLMCEADGFTPDDIVTRQVPEVGPKGSIIIPKEEYATYPAWHLYARQAMYMIERGVTFDV